MLFLLDTGVILRIFNPADPLHVGIRKSIRQLKRAGHRLALSTQNVTEFWNASTRPAAARGGYGLTVEQTERRVQFLEKYCEVIPDSAELYTTWRRLVLKHEVKGAKVHDARLVAWMETLAITHIVTLNASDFARFEKVVALSPQEAVS